MEPNEPEEIKEPEPTKEEKEESPVINQEPEPEPEPEPIKEPEPEIEHLEQQQETAEARDTIMSEGEEKNPGTPPKSDSPDVLDLEEDANRSDNSKGSPESNEDDNNPIEDNHPQDHIEDHNVEQHNDNIESNEESVEGENNPNVEEEDKHSERVIEGIVQGDVEELNDDGQDFNFLSPSDEEVKEMVETANMEQLAALVLNGDGDRLVGQVANNAELQTFLDNVPAYMVNTFKKQCFLQYKP